MTNAIAALENARHERFAQLVATGSVASFAYCAAGYAGKGARASAARLLTNGRVASRIRWIRDERESAALAAAKVDAARIQRELEAISFSDPLNYFEGGADDLAPGLRSLSDWSPSARAAVASAKVRQETQADGNTVEEVVGFRLWNKLDAISQLREHMGLTRTPDKASPATRPGAIEVRVVVEQQAPSRQDTQRKGSGRALRS